MLTLNERILNDIFNIYTDKDVGKPVDFVLLLDLFMCLLPFVHFLSSVLSLSFIYIVGELSSKSER